MVWFLLCVVCEKKCFKKVGNWRELSPEWASQRNIDYWKAHAAAGAGSKGMARLCFNCRTKKTKKRDVMHAPGQAGRSKPAHGVMYGLYHISDLY